MNEPRMEDLGIPKQCPARGNTNTPTECALDEGHDGEHLWGSREDGVGGFAGSHGERVPEAEVAWSQRARRLCDARQPERLCALDVGHEDEHVWVDGPKLHFPGFDRLRRKLLAGLPTATGARAAPVQWEYATFYLLGVDGEDLGRWTHAGRHGWELVSVVEREGEPPVGYFKRRRVV